MNLSDHAHGAHHLHHLHQFETPEQQYESATLGMWAFIVQEILFFGGLFGAYTVYRNTYIEAYIPPLCNHACNDQSDTWPWHRTICD